MKSHFWAYIADIFLPRHCLVCGTQLYQFEQHICTRCLYDLPRTFFWQNKYNKMSEKFNAVLQSHLQKEESMFRYPVKYVYGVALFYYEEESGYREITRTLKYGYNLPSGRFFSRILLRYLRQCFFLGDATMIAPVPLHFWRKWKRGYNQAAVIAKELADGLGIDMVEDLLIRKQATKSQAQLTREEKLKNVENSFKMNRKYLPLFSDGRPHHLILVDDVFTTGSTMFACYKAVMEEIYKENIDFNQIRISLVTLGYVGN